MRTIGRWPAKTPRFSILMISPASTELAPQVALARQVREGEVGVGRIEVNQRQGAFGHHRRLHLRGVRLFLHELRGRRQSVGQGLVVGGNLRLVAISATGKQRADEHRCNHVQR
jgi:hypothetical protein